MFAIFSNMERENRNVLISYSMIVVLIIVGTLFITLLEWDNPATLGALDPGLCDPPARRPAIADLGRLVIAPDRRREPKSGYCPRPERS